LCDFCDLCGFCYLCGLCGSKTLTFREIKQMYFYRFLTLSDPTSDLVRHYDFPVPDAFTHVLRTLANR
jgi:hypothetical protein